ncbi:glycosyltransferase family 2 protein [Methylobacterium sp. CM6257]
MENLPALRVAIVIASKGRPHTLSQWRELLEDQTIKPSSVVYSVSHDRDLPEENRLFPSHVIVKGAAGASRQRNRGIEAVLHDCDLLAFFDDDYIPATNCIENIAEFMHRNPDVAGANGLLLRDGINSEAVDFEDAKAILKDYIEGQPDDFSIKKDLVGLYGCNMVFRASAIGNIRFDEKLPLYSWQEDIDFAVQVGRNGRTVATNSFAGIHQGIKSSRTSGKQLGYSQIANPIYLIRKGTMPATFGVRLMIKNVISNHVKLFKPERWVDRRGRTVGNWLAIRDLLTNRLDPEKILRF